MKTKSTSQTARKLIKKAILFTITALALSASPGSRAAGDCLLRAYWDHSGTGNWFDPLNWGPTHNAVPDCGQCCGHGWEADINNRGTAQISGLTPIAYACEVLIGYQSGDSGTLSVDHGTLNQCGDLFVGSYGTGKLTITNGGLVNTQFEASIAEFGGSNGAVTVDGTNADGRKSTWTVTVDGAVLSVGGTNGSAGGTGLLTVTNGAGVNAASVYVYKSGTLTGGNGTVTTTATSGTTVDGTISRTVGTLTISGNLGLTSNATTQYSVTPQDLNQVDVSVSGTASLDGRLLVTMTGTFTPSSQFTLLHAAGGLDPTHNRFASSSITYPPVPTYTPVITYDAYNVYVYLRPN